MKTESINPQLSPEDENTSTEIVIDIKDLKKSFGSNDVLKGLTISVARGENLVVLGKSGSGKSVLIKCIVGLIEPDAGMLTVLGENILELESNLLNDMRRKIGFLFQSGALYDSMTVRENLEFPLRNSAKLKKEEIDALVEEALDNVGLLDSIDKMPSELSGGMRKRVGLARTLILKPKIMLYDEPTTGLDPITSKDISTLILNVRKKYNTSSIIITHDIACAKITADRIIVIQDGICAAEGTFEELQQSDNPEVRSYFK